MWGSPEEQNEEMLADDGLLMGFVDCGIWQLEELLSQVASD